MSEDRVFAKCAWRLMAVYGEIPSSFVAAIMAGFEAKADRRRRVVRFSYTRTA
jgi:hypothetical protein